MQASLSSSSQSALHVRRCESVALDSAIPGVLRLALAGSIAVRQYAEQIHLCGRAGHAKMSTRHTTVQGRQHVHTVWKLVPEDVRVGLRHRCVVAVATLHKPSNGPSAITRGERSYTKDLRHPSALGHQHSLAMATTGTPDISSIATRVGRFCPSNEGSNFVAFSDAQLPSRLRSFASISTLIRRQRLRVFRQPLAAPTRAPAVPVSDDSCWCYHFSLQSNRQIIAIMTYYWMRASSDISASSGLVPAIGFVDTH